LGEGVAGVAGVQEFRSSGVQEFRRQETEDRIQKVDRLQANLECQFYLGRF
jgi:hypothetical protein